jgi:WD40 repeat protein
MARKDPHQTYAHDAFISYSRKDNAFAQKLEVALEKFSPPRQLAVPHKRLDIFRDVTDFTGVDYHKSVGDHLRSSAKLIVVCSPNARNSPYVDEEIRRFAQDHDTVEIIPVLWAGAPNNESESEAEKAFPEALCELLNMPLAVDYRNVDIQREKLDRGRLYNAWYTLLANLYDVSRAEVEQREESRRRRRRLTITAAAVAVNLIILAFASVAVWQRGLAVERLFDANQNLARVFEEKAQVQLEEVFRTGSPAAAEQVWLYSLSALMLPRRPNTNLPVSVGRLSLPEVRSLAFSEVWSSQVPPDDFSAVAFSPDGELIAVASGTDVILFDVKTRQETGRLKGHLKEVRTIAFSPDGATLASGSGIFSFGIFSGDNSIRLWNVAERRQDWKLKGHDGPINSVAFNKDGTVLASGSSDGTVRLWQTSTGSEIATLTGHVSPVQGVAFVPEQEVLISVSGDPLTPGVDNSILIWDPVRLRQIGKLDTKPDPKYKLHNPILSVAVSSNGRWIAAGATDNVVRIWDASNLSSIAQLTGHETSVSSLSFSPTEGILASGSKVISGISGGGTIRLWDIPSGKEIAQLHGHTDTISGLAFGPDGTTLASVSSDGELRLWNVSSQSEITRLDGLQKAVLGRKIAFSPDGQLLATGTEDGTIHVLNSADGRELWRTRGHAFAVEDIAFAPTEHQLATMTRFDLKLWDLDKKTDVAIFSAEDGELTCMAISPNGQLLAVGHEASPSAEMTEGTAFVLSLPSGEVLASLAHTAGLRSIAFDPSSSLIATGSTDGLLSLWNAETGDHLFTLSSHTRPVYALAFSPDGKTLASAAGYDLGGMEHLESAIFDTLLSTGFDKLSTDELAEGYAELEEHIASTSPKDADGADYAIRLWNIETRSESARLTGHEDAIKGIAFSPDGAMLATASLDGTTRLWSLPERTEIARIQSDQEHFEDVAFNPGGYFFATSSDFLRLWKTPFSEQLAPQHDESILSIAVSDGNDFIASGGEDKYIRLWNRSSLEFTTEFAGHDGAIETLAFSQDGRILASGSRDSTVRIWDVGQGNEMACVDSEFPIRSVAINPRGTLLAISGQDPAALARTNEIRLWSIDESREIAVLEGHTNTVGALAFHPTEDTLVSTSVDHTIRIWDVAAGKAIGILAEDYPIGRSVTFSADGGRLAVAGGSWIGSEDSFVSVWDYPSLEMVATFEGHSDMVWTVQFGRNRNELVSGSADGTVRIWDIEAQKELVRFEGHSPVFTLALDLHRNSILSSSKNSLRIIDLEPVAIYSRQDTDPGAVVVSVQSASFKISNYVMNDVKLVPRGQQPLALTRPGANEMRVSESNEFADAMIESGSLEQEILLRTFTATSIPNGE